MWVFPNLFIAMYAIDWVLPLFENKGPKTSDNESKKEQFSKPSEWNEHENARDKAREDLLSALCIEHSVDITDRDAAITLVLKLIPASEQMQYLHFTDVI